MLASKLMSALAEGTEEKLYVDDVFSTYLYTGKNGTQAINNGIDLAGKGGLVWIKSRDKVESNALNDTARGANKVLRSDTTGAESSPGYGEISTFNSNGFSGSLTGYGAASSVIWTFRKAPKFFDVVTWTGDGTTDRKLSHNLGGEPGLIIAKLTNTSSNWIVYHRSLGLGKAMYLDLTNSVQTTANVFPLVNDTEFTITSLTGWNASGQTGVAYLFAHDPSEDGLIQCGSYVGNGSASGPTVTLGWEPQLVMVKMASGSDNHANWYVWDSMRGFTTNADAYLNWNNSNIESWGSDGVPEQLIDPTSTGFKLAAVGGGGINNSGSTYIYLAIRRPNKPPTSGTEVFEVGQNRTSLAQQIVGTIGPIDLTLQTQVPAPLSAYHFAASDRLRGNVCSVTSATNSESGAYLSFDTNVGVRNLQWFSNGGLWYNFKRAPGFFDVVCYTGTGVGGTQVPHNLGVKPELFIIKKRKAAGNWLVWTPRTGGFLNSSISLNFYTFGNGKFNATDASFGLSSDTAADNTIGDGYVAYLFASLPGISKVGSYTGNGSSQTIDCGFSTGARFILIKRTDSTGDWYVWDTARGIVAANDPHLSLNTTAAEVTTDDSVDPHVSGFIVNQVAATNINVSGGQYIFLAIA